MLSNMDYPNYSNLKWIMGIDVTVRFVKKWTFNLYLMHVKGTKNNKRYDAKMSRLLRTGFGQWLVNIFGETVP